MFKSASNYIVPLLVAALAKPVFAEDANFFIEFTPIDDQPLVFWEQMLPEQRAALWPLLTQEQRLNHWRLMNKKERRDLRERIAPFNRMRHQYAQQSLTGKTQEHHMNHAERRKMREQIRAVYHELKAGVPFDCSDPRNCPHEFIRIIDTHH